MKNWRAYLIPGLVFQSVLVGGGYATGRELVEFFMPSGPLGGVFGLLVAGCMFALILGTAYEFARITKSFDYRTFCKHLLGPAWVLYEIAYIAIVILVLAVVGSAAGVLIDQAFGIDPFFGTLAMTALVGALTYLGSNAIGMIFAFWSFVLYAVYIALFAITFATYGDDIQSAFTQPQDTAGWTIAGIRYAAYNISLPAVLFCIPLLQARREAFGAGLMTGIIAIFPALVFYIAMLSQYPEIADQPVPALYLMSQLNTNWLGVLFQIVVFGTFIETGAGLLHSINERIEAQAAESQRHLPRWGRAAIPALLLILSVYAADRVGIIALIASGYGILSWAFIILLVLPLLTIGVWRIALTPSKGNPHADD